MGAAGIAMLGMIYCFFKSIISVINYFIWKSKIDAIGIVEELKDKKVIYENEKKKKILSIEYIYAISFDYNGTKQTVEYIEKVSGDKPSGLEISSSLPIFVDVNTNLAKNKNDIKSQMWQWPLGFLLSTAMLIICMIIAALLSS